MVKLVELFTEPEDIDEFDRQLHGEHVPRLQALPSLERIEIARFTGGPLGAPPYHLMAELYFADHMAMQAALASEEWRAGQKALRFAQGLVTIMFAEECEVRG